MVADVMDESLLLIRQVDNEECDSAEVGNYVQSFADRIQMLIVMSQSTNASRTWRYGFGWLWKFFVQNFRIMEFSLLLERLCEKMDQ